MQKIMVCGIDCMPGGVNCNNYCNHDTSKPMADCAPAATQGQQLASAKKVAYKKLRAAEVAWFEYFGLCEVGPDREHAAAVYDNVRMATRV